MTTQTSNPHLWIHRCACLTTGLVLLPIILGALTTTQGAGMAFPDWPTSDGQGMFSYPWLQLISDLGTNRESYDKFLEHGHRLAGILIGLAAIALAVVCYGKNSNKSLKILGTAVLLAVIFQGLLGGYRVELNQRGLAMIHGLFASFVFTLMCVTCVVSSRGWTAAADAKIPTKISRIWYASIAFYAYLIMQYVLGGLIRHPLGTRSPIHEHLGFGIIAVALVHGLLFMVIRAQMPWLRQAMRYLLIVVCLQVILGLATYVAKWGFSTFGITAVAGSTAQVLTRTGHMVLGVLVVGSAAVLACRAYRLWTLSKNHSLQENREPDASPSSELASPSIS